MIDDVDREARADRATWDREENDHDPRDELDPQERHSHAQSLRHRHRTPTGRRSVPFLPPPDRFDPALGYDDDRPF